MHNTVCCMFAPWKRSGVAFGASRGDLIIYQNNPSKLLPQLLTQLCHYIRVEDSATESLQHLINIADLSVLLVDLTKF